MISADFISILGILIPAMSAIAVAYLGILTSKKSKKDDAYRQLQEKNRHLEKEKKQEEEEKRLKEFNELQTNFQKLSGSVSNLKESCNITKLEEQLNQLNQLNQMNFTYIQSLSTVVTTMGEAVLKPGDEKAETNMQEAISTHQKTEKKIINNLYRIVT